MEPTLQATTVYHGQLHPPFSTTVSSVRPATMSSKLKKAMTAILGLGLIGGFICAGGYKFWDMTGLYICIAISSLMLMAALFVIFRSQAAACPVCGFDLGSSSDITIGPNDDKSQEECPRCCEWLISDKGTVRHFNEEDAKGKDKFSSPVFDMGNWPMECIVCGDPITHYGQAKKTNMNVSKLLVGRVSVSTGSVNNIPYCAAHNDGVSLDIKYGSLILNFNDYGARRRYLAMNPNRVKYKK
jgi:hypothetical protein